MNSHARIVAVFIGLVSACAPANAERLVLASASYGKNIIAICDANGKVLWSHKTAGPKTGHAGHHDIQLLDNGNFLFHENWTTIIEMTLDKKVVWKYDSSTMNGNQGKRVEVHAFRRLPTGLTMIAESGVGRIIEVDKDGRIHAEVKLKPGETQNTRMVRKLDTGNYLVCAENPGVVTEYNPKSEVIWEYPIRTRVYGAIRLHNGNTLVASGGGASVVEVTRDNKIVWEIKDTVPDTRIELKWTTFLTELDNGNFIVGNCHAGENSPQIFEITRDKKIVWQFNRYDIFGNGLACSQILSDEQSALVRKRLAAALETAGEQYGVTRTTIEIGKHKRFILQPAVPADEGARQRDALWAAVRAGDVKTVAAALDNGADVNAKNEIGVSALWIAAGKDKPDVIELLVQRGADVNARDGIWYQTPLSASVGGKQLAAAELLIKAGARDVDAALFSAASQGNEAMVKMILDRSKLSQDALDAALYAVITAKKEKLEEALKKAGAKPLPTASEKDRAAWEKLVGTYESDGGAKMVLMLKEAGLVYGGRWLKPTGPDTFVPLGSEGVRMRIERRGGDVARITMTRFTAEYSFYRFNLPVERKTPALEIGGETGGAPANWPSFRGPDGTGVADGQHPPVTWNIKTGTNVRWKTPIPGLGHSCPIVWGDRVFVTTAVSGDPDPKIRIGNYGDVASVNDKSKHSWQVLCLDRDTGAILWTRTAHEGVPKIKRHLKGSQANCTPATDGTHVIACFGSEGLYCYDFAGKLLWNRDLSTLDSSFAIDQEYEWGFGNSPLIHEGLAILQCDLSRDSFIAAFNVENGEKVWSTPRDEIPSWSSPVIWRNIKRVELVTNAAQYARGYDPKTGAELWRLAKKSEVTIPTPVCGKDLLFITSGNRPIQPIFAIRPGAKGDISLNEKQETNTHIAWSKMRGGPYMPTPILYGPHFYTCSNSGILACYEAATGKEVYKERISSGGDSYTASPVASDGRLYFAAEQGQVRIVKAGPTFELLAVNTLDDYVMATPAISNGSLFVRSQHFLMALGKKPDGETK